MIIDAHAHFCGELSQIKGILHYMKSNTLKRIVLCPGEHHSKRGYPLPMFTDLIPSEAIGYTFNKIIRRMVALTGMAEAIDEQNRQLGLLSREYPEQILHAYWLDPLDAKGVSRMDSRYHQMPFCMVKLHQCWHDFDLAGPEVLTAVQWAESFRLPVFIHLQSAGQCRAFSALANHYPDCLFIVAHMIGYDIIAPRLRYDNVYFDLSAPFMIPFRYLEDAVRRWGGDRLLLGSDTPYGHNNLRRNMHRIERLELGKSEKEKICGRNFESILALRPPAG